MPIAGWLEPRPQWHRGVQAAKRVGDVVAVVALSPLWLPVLGLSTLGVLLSGGSPIAFSQTRMGLNGRPFRIWKLRTMNPKIAAPDSLKFAGWTAVGDPRVTPIGRVLRKYRLDELPQLVNVLRGDMSLVGPRPEPFDVATSLGDQIENYHKRHWVRPGLTGLCQVSPIYGQFGTIEQQRAKTKLDLEYVEQLSIGLDLTIVLRTFAVLLRGAGTT